VKLSEGIRRVGFRKWYERELLQSHAMLALCFMCMIGLFAAFEAMRHVDATEDRVADVIAVAICAAVGLWSLRRYLYLLNHAEAVANQADCPRCREYARFNLMAHDGELLRVRCKKCEQEWNIAD
jgi:hypothetical protein